MHTPSPHRSKPSPDRLAGWARLWLSCIATLLTYAAHLLPPAHRRRLPLLNLPRTMLAGFVTRLVLLCAITNASAPAKAAAPQPGDLRAVLRAGMRKHLKNASGALDLARIAHTCANPDAAIADMIAALERRLTRRTPICRAGRATRSAHLRPSPPRAPATHRKRAPHYTIEKC